MCRYTMYGPYKQHYACFSCRKMFRKERFNDNVIEHLCPQCRQPMENMGLDFKAPPNKDSEQWRVVKLLASHNIRYHSCGCSGPGYRPRRLKEVPGFLQSSTSLSPGQLLLKRIPRQRIRVKGRTYS